MTVSARTLTAFSAALLCASVAANIVLALPNAVGFFPLFFFVHVAIVGLGIWVVLRIRRLRTSWSEVIRALSSVPKWLLAAGAITVAVAAFSARGINFDMGTLPDGSPIHSKNWRERDGRYWLSLNKGPATEISSAEYQKLQRESYAFFATGWVLFSYLLLIQWHYVTRRESAGANAA
jgi:hypothetical protein